MKTTKDLSFNCLLLILIAGIFFIGHKKINSVLQSPINDVDLLYAYSFNGFLAVSVLVFVFFFKKKLQDYLGFAFMAASFIKFLLFFILFYPRYYSDGSLSKLEFLTFFIPYAVCLIIEVIILSRFLNTLDDYK